MFLAQSQFAACGTIVNASFSRELMCAACCHLVQDKDMVVSLLSMKASLDTVLAEAFQGNVAFGNAVKEAFEHFINQRQNK